MPRPQNVQTPGTASLTGRIAKHALSLLLFFTLVVTSRLAAESPPTASANVAVLDFQMAAASQTPDNWAVGLADLLAVELEQQGVPVLERGQIRLVLHS